MIEEDNEICLRPMYSANDLSLIWNGYRYYKIDYNTGLIH